MGMEGRARGERGRGRRRRPGKARREGVSGGGVIDGKARRCVMVGNRTNGRAGTEEG